MSPCDGSLDADIEEQAFKLHASDLPSLGELAQRVVNPEPQPLAQLSVRMAPRGVLHKADDRCAQRAVLREERLTMRPESLCVELWYLLERVEAPGVAVTRHVAGLRQHPEHGGTRSCAKHSLNRLKVCD